MALLAAAVCQAVALPTPQGEPARRQGEFLRAAGADRAVADEWAAPPAGPASVDRAVTRGSWGRIGSALRLPVSEAPG
jgi:hypothetical protein